MKILLVDNNKVILRLMSHLLEEMGHEVRTAVDGLNALEVLEYFAAEVVFVDLVMPKINGEKLCRILRSMPEMDSLFIVVFSAIAAEQQLNCKEFGANACIAKGPFKEIKEHVKNVLAQAKSHDYDTLPEGILGSDKIFEREITKELLSTKQHYEIALNRISDAFLELTSGGQVVYANTAACKLLDLPEEKVLTSQFADFFSKDQQPLIRDFVARVNADPLIVGEDEPLEIGDKQVSLNMVAVTDMDHRFIVTVMHDITNRKKVEQQLKEYQGNLEMLVAERTLELLEANEKLQRDIVERKKLYVQKEELIRELEDALAKVKTLSGFLPICSSCKKIRDDKGYWLQVEAYIGRHSEAAFSHSICPDCSQELYPEIHKKKK